MTINTHFVSPNRLCATLSAAALLAGAALLAPSAVAQSHEHEQHAPANAAAQMSAGEVIKVDKEAGKITIKHGPLANLNMPGMTMVFKVKDPSMLDRVKAGDKISFSADKVNGALTVTKLDAAN